MAILTVNFMRMRSELKTFSNASLGAIETAYASYESGKAADTTKTWTVRVVNGYWDGLNYVLIAEASYPERNEDFNGQVPALP